MTLEGLRQLTPLDLRAIATALRTDRLAVPPSALGLWHLVSSREVAVESAARDLAKLVAEGMKIEHVVLLLEALAEERAGRRALEDSIDLVSTGPEGPGVANRDTAVVLRELFGGAERTVLVAGYAVFGGHSVFRALSQRMRERPGLDVTLFLDVHRPRDNTCTTTDAEIVSRFARNFRDQEWPGERLPTVYFDPRALDPDPKARAVLHAKCVVVDEEKAFISSANLTPAAQARNIEVGVLIRSTSFASQLAGHLRGLIEGQHVRRVELGGR
jgi:phosphatidylserine/phosphatidylglycerophosphate/cardiolipin synthase-like enzyme